MDRQRSDVFSLRSDRDYLSFFGGIGCEPLQPDILTLIARSFRVPGVSTSSSRFFICLAKGSVKSENSSPWY